MTILHINIRSLNKNLDKLEDLLENMKHSPDLIAISETKLKNHHDLNIVSLPGYIFINSNSTSFCGGVGLYIKQGLSFTIRNDLHFTCDQHKSVWTELKSVNGKEKSLIIGVLYRHPGNPIKEFKDNFSTFLSTISEENKDICVIGDININLMNIDTDSSIKTYSNMLTSFNLTNMINLPTRITGTTRTIIDHLYHNDSNKFLNAAIIISDISDHFPLLVAIKRNNVNPSEEPIFCRDYSKIHSQYFNTQAHTLLHNYINTHLFNNNLQVDEKLDILTESLRKLLNEIMPIKKINCKKTRRKNRPWISKSIMKDIKTRNKTFDKLCKSNFQNKRLCNVYKEQRNNVTHKKFKAKKDYYQRILQYSKGDIKQTWKTINKITKRGKNKSNIPTEIEHDGLKINDPREVLNHLNTHFATVGNTFSSKKVDYSKISSYLNKTITNSFAWHDVSYIEILELLSNIKKKKSCGWDDISIPLIIQLKEPLSYILSVLINESFYQGIYPKSLKLAKVIPLHKGGNKKDPSNYRPISILTNFNKIFEKILYSRLYDFFEKNGVIYEGQFGFRKGHSTSMAASVFVEHVMNAWDQQKATCAIMLDLSKAFDTIDRGIVLHKLYNCGIRGNMRSLLSSYLENRTQFVSGTGLQSDTTNTEVGVPQGSVLSPLLFLIHLNDFERATNFKIINFADDSLLYKSFDSTDNIEHILNKELINVDSWLTNNHLKINTKKTKFMFFSPNTKLWNKADNITLKINNNILEEVNNYKYLGLIIDNKLNWKHHIDSLHTKLSRTIGIL